MADRNPFLAVIYSLTALLLVALALATALTSISGGGLFYWAPRHGFLETPILGGPLQARAR
jgi:hypothetical protein